MSFTPTQEQVTAAQMYASGESLRIEALAGTGKTTTLEYLVRSGLGRGRALYTSFGRKVIDDAKRRFPSTCRVATNHGLAWGVGVRYQNAGRLRGRLSAGDLAQQMGWHDGEFAPHASLNAGAFGVIETISRFCQSGNDTIEFGHALDSAMRQLKARRPADIPQYAARLADTANEVWARMASPRDTMPIHHDVYLKLWAMGRPKLNYSTILLDEAQDANGVIVGVLEHQPHAQLVIVGDRYQAIYGWRGAVDAMDRFPIEQRCALTQSWRFGPTVAALANKILDKQCGARLQLRGDPSRPSHVGVVQPARCLIARTNATLVADVFLTAQKHPDWRLGVVGGVDDLLKLIDAAERLMAGKPAFHPELDEFESWTDVVAAVEDEGYQHLRVLVDLVTTYGTSALRAVLLAVRGNEMQPERCHRLVSTAHKAKGSEYDSVELADDFTVMGPPSKPDMFGWKPEDGNLLYVAATRARQGLDPTGCSAIIETLGPEFPQFVTTEKEQVEQG